MPLRFPLLLVLAVSLLAGTAQAQSTPSAPSTEGQGQGQAPNVTTTRFKNWAMSCRDGEEGGPRQCSIFQRLVVQDTEQVALNIAVGYLRGNQGGQTPVAILTFPLGIYLPGGARLQVDSTEPLELPIERCFRRGCQTGFAFDEQRIAQFKAGSTASVKIMQARDQEIDLTVSLSGFSAAFAALAESAGAAN